MLSHHTLKLVFCGMLQLGLLMFWCAGVEATESPNTCSGSSAPLAGTAVSILSLCRDSDNSTSSQRQPAGLSKMIKSRGGGPVTVPDVQIDQTPLSHSRIDLPAIASAGSDLHNLDRKTFKPKKRLHKLANKAFRDRAMLYANNPSNCTMPSPKSLAEEKFLHNVIRLKKEAAIAEAQSAIAGAQSAIAEAQSAIARKENKIGDRLWVSTVMQLGLGLAGVCLAFAFVFASFNIGRGADVVWNDIRNWLLSVGGKYG